MVGAQERRRGGGHDGVQRVAVGVLRVERREAPAEPVHESRHHEGSGEILFFCMLYFKDVLRETTIVYFVLVVFSLASRFLVSRV